MNVSTGIHPAEKLSKNVFALLSSTSFFAFVDVLCVCVKFY